MTASQKIRQTIETVLENELIFASKLYYEQFQNEVTESAFYQTLGRLCKAGVLCRLAKGTYYRPKASKYGIIPPSQKEIISAFTEPSSGTVVGYSLYNDLKLTTQISKTVEVFSSKIEQQTKSVSNVLLQFCDLIYTPQVTDMVHMLEVLQNFNEIQDLNYAQFVRLCVKFAPTYDNRVFERVIQQTHYQKRTISFLRTILNYYHVPNGLGKYLSTLSQYKHPTMEEIYEAAQLS